jgi:tight adherence protein B
MIALAASLCIGTFCYFLAATLTGQSFVTFRRPPRPLVSARQLWLNQAGVAVTPRQFALGSLGAAAVAFSAVAVVTGAPLVALVPAIGVGLLPRAYFGRRRSARLREVQAAWPDGLRDLMASVQAGQPLTAALVALAAHGPAPLREAFARFPALARMAGTVPALEIVKEELADPTSDRVLDVLALAYQRGGEIVKDVLGDLVVATTKDLRTLDEIESEGLEMKLNGRAVLVMPWLVLVMLTVRAGPFRDFYRSGAGLVVVVVGAVMSGLGQLWLAHLGRDDEEPRVLGATGTDLAR